MLMIHMKYTSVLERAVTFSIRIKMISKKSVVHCISYQLNIFFQYQIIMLMNSNWLIQTQKLTARVNGCNRYKKCIFMRAVERHSFNEVNEFPQISTCWNFPKIRKQPKYITYQRYPTFSITMLMRFIDISAILSLAANILKTRIYFDFKAFLLKKPVWFIFRNVSRSFLRGFS